MRKIIVFVTIVVLIGAVAVAQMMPDSMMGGSMMEGDKPKASEDPQGHCIQMMTQMSEMMKQMAEMKTHMSMMMEGGMMGGMMGPKKKANKEESEKAKLGDPDEPRQSSPSCKRSDSRRT